MSDEEEQPETITLRLRDTVRKKPSVAYMTYDGGRRNDSAKASTVIQLASSGHRRKCVKAHRNLQMSVYTMR
jgi:hypothetical protein